MDQNEDDSLRSVVESDGSVLYLTVVDRLG
jgi:hypothetical protein